jgi:hypothetical protein
MKLRPGLLDHDAPGHADQLPAWLQPLQTLSSILGLQLRVEWVDNFEDLEHPCISDWLSEHGHIISHLSTGVYIDGDLQLKEFAEAAVPCKAINLKIMHSHI